MVGEVSIELPTILIACYIRVSTGNLANFIEKRLVETKEQVELRHQSCAVNNSDKVISLEKKVHQICAPGPDDKSTLKALFAHLLAATIKPSKNLRIYSLHTMTPELQ